MASPYRFLALLSDLDGTLLDTEPIYYRAYALASAALGSPSPYTPAFHATHLLGKPESAGVAAFLSHQGLSAAPAQVLALRDAHALPAFPTCAPLPGAEAAVGACVAAGLRAAVVTSSKRHLVELKARGAPGLLAQFQLTLCSDDEALRGCAGKPHPACYQKAAELLGVPPSHCLVLEDSVAGMAAGVAAGCFVVGVPDKLLDRRAVEGSGAHLVLWGGLGEFVLGEVEARAAAWAAGAGAGGAGASA